MKKHLYLLFIIISLVITSCTSAGKLEFIVATSSEECPMVIDEVTTCVDIFTENKNVVYKCTFDEDEAGIYLSKMDNLEYRKVQKKIMLEYLKKSKYSDEEVREMINLCKDAKYDIIYRFIGTVTGYKYEIVLSSHEL